MTTPAAPAYLSYGADFADIYDAIFPRNAIGPDELDWLADRIGTGRRVLELGVGTGRVAIPLAARLTQQNNSVEYHGTDISPQMLDQLAIADTSGHILATQGDIVHDAYSAGYDSILCVCATISMITDPTHQAQVFKNASNSLKPGGTLIVETHNAELVRSFHGARTKITYAVPYPGDQRALVSFSTLNQSSWSIDHCWIDDGTARFASEASRLTTLDELDGYAAAAGLEVVAHTSGLNGSHVSSNVGTVTAEYRKPSLTTLRTRKPARDTILATRQE